MHLMISFFTLSYESTTKVIEIMLKISPYGIFHYSGERDITYYEFCKLVNIRLSKLGKKINLFKTTSKEMGS